MDAFPAEYVLKKHLEGWKELLHTCPYGFILIVLHLEDGLYDCSVFDFCNALQGRNLYKAPQWLRFAAQVGLIPSSINSSPAFSVIALGSRTFRIRCADLKTDMEMLKSLEKLFSCKLSGHPGATC